MTVEQQLAAAVIALWGVLTTVVTGALVYLKAELIRRDIAWETRLKADEAACETRISRLEAKLDEASATIQRQAESQQRQIDAQATLLSQQAQLIVVLQAAVRGEPA